MLKQSGFTLTELLVGSTLGLVVLAGALQLYQSNVTATAANLRLSRLHYEAREILGLIATELRRSGYWAGTPGVDAVMDNPFMRAPFDLRIGGHAQEAADSCVLYSYDRYPDQRVGTGSLASNAPATTSANMELFGFRLSGQRIQMRNGGRRFTCDSGSWQSLTGSDTRITRLAFQLQRDCLNIGQLGQACRRGQPAQLVRTVRVTLAARSASDPRMAISLDSRVHLANDRLVKQW